MNEARLLKAAAAALGAKGRDPYSEGLLEKVYGENRSVFCPRSVFALFEKTDAGFCGADISLEGESAKRHLDGASFALFQAFTLGAAVDKRIKELSYSRPSEGVALNAVASIYAEMAADEALQEQKNSLTEKGFETNFRFCPGYGDLALTANAEIAAALFATKRIGLCVTEEGLLLPKKSIVGFCGVFSGKKE